MSEHKKLMRMTARAFYATSYARERLNARAVAPKPTTSTDKANSGDVAMMDVGAAPSAVKAPVVDKKTKIDDPRVVEVVVDLSLIHI